MISDDFKEIYERLRNSRDFIQENYPEFFKKYNKVGSVHQALIDNLEDYQDRITQLMQREDMVKNHRIKFDLQDLLFRNFLYGLSEFGDVALTKDIFEVIGKKKLVFGAGKSRGVFVDNDFKGILTHFIEKCSLEYDGEYPNTGYVRLLYLPLEQERVDGWNIVFP